MLSAAIPRDDDEGHGDRKEAAVIGVPEDEAGRKRQLRLPRWWRSDPGESAIDSAPDLKWMTSSGPRRRA
jgi:hypothetical protein